MALSSVLWAVIVVFFVLWVLGFTYHIGGGIIHILLVIVLVALVYNLVTGRRPIV